MKPGGRDEPSPAVLGVTLPALSSMVAAGQLECRSHMSAGWDGVAQHSEARPGHTVTGRGLPDGRSDLLPAHPALAPAGLTPAELETPPPPPPSRVEPGRAVHGAP